jgi:hypothetical protein
VLSKLIEDQLLKAAPAPSRPFPQIHHFLEDQESVALAGKTTTIFEYYLPKNSYGVVRRIANTYYPGDKLQWILDGAPLSRRPITRVIGTYPNSPTQVFVEFYDFTKWECLNPSNKNHSYGVVVDGYYGARDQREIIREMLLRGVI